MTTRLPSLAAVLTIAAVLLVGCTPADPAPTSPPSASASATPTSAPGESIAAGGWDIAATVQHDVGAAVAAANEFNTTAAAGHEYVLVAVELERTGEPTHVFDIEFTLTVKGEQILPAKVWAPQQLLTLSEVITGEAVAGNIVFEVPSASADALMLRVRAGDDTRFIALSEVPRT